MITDASDDPRPPRKTSANDAHLEETRQSGARVYLGALLDVRRDPVTLPDGGTAIREYSVHPGAVLIVPVLADGRLVVERQHRYPLNRVFVEFPAGKVDPGETPLATAQREL
ncbi:MAG: NUDIX hydrolase, partial [Casimicrobiaceae bacterium]